MEAELVIRNGFPVCPVWSFKVRIFAVVEVAFTVRTDLTSGEEVPMPTLSVRVVSLTIVPSSVQPGSVAPASGSQITFPLESEAKAFAPWQLWIVEILNPPAMTSSPLNVLVAELVCKILPPEIVRPEAEESPPPATLMPELVKVEVAAPWTIREEVAINPCTVVVPATKALPCTENKLAGEVVPIPKLPEVLMVTLAESKGAPIVKSVPEPP